MKISILTFHNVPNFGAFLQVYALSKFISSYGHEVDIINLELVPPNVSTAGKTLNYINNIKFKQYRSNFLSLTKKIDNFSELDDYDLYIVGSDQVWNKDITKKNYLKYFFEGLGENKNIISYAGSFGKNKWIYDTSETAQIKALLNKFNAISVRESIGAEFCTEYLSLDSEIVVDPTLLLDNYDELVKVKKVKENQIACFKFSRDSSFYSFAKQIKNLGFELIELRGLFPNKGTRIVPFPSVGDWLGYIKYAPFVLTDSFHGLCFSIIFNKNFIVIPADLSKFNRIENILKLLGLEDRIFRSYNEILSDNRWMKPIDYNLVNDKLGKLREQSRDFLLRFL